MLGLGFGATGCTDDLCDGSFIAPMVFVQAQVLQRFLKFVAVGLHLSANFFYPKDIPDGVNATVLDFVIGPEARGIFPVGPLDIWSGIVLGYMGHFSRSSSSEGSAESAVHGFGFGWGLGANYFFLPRMGVGLAFWLYKPYYAKMCISVDAGGISDSDCSSVDSQDGVGITWSVGANFVVMFGR